MGIDSDQLSCPDKIRANAWQYVQGFTKEHERAVMNMYNNRPPSVPNIDANQDVTCGIGFRLATIEDVWRPEIRCMFYDPVTNSPATKEQLEADWRQAANLARDGNLAEYSQLCHMRMYPEMVDQHMAEVLKQKLGDLLRFYPRVFGDINKFPAAAQAFCMSFAYGRIPIDFPMMRAAIQLQDWKGAAAECHVVGLSTRKDEAHKNLLIFAQMIVDQGGNYDSVPSNYYPADH
jgi:hypothetical protein